MKIFSTEQIKKWDAFTIVNEPITSIGLMERAATACYRWIIAHSDTTKPFYIFCGKGNNGGDGLAIARMLVDRNCKVTVYILELSPDATDDFQANLERLREFHGDIHYIHDTATLPLIPSNSIIIDAIVGSGLNRPLDGLSALLVNQINSSGAEIISIDIPSGLFADKSSKGYPVINADTTLSFQTVKLSFFMPENKEYVGDFFVLDIGLHPQYEIDEASSVHLILKTDVQLRYQPRNKFSHKGDFGHALIIAGSHGKMGAAVLSAKACLRSGAGLVTTYIPKCGYEIMQSSFPEAMCVVDENEDFISTIPELKNYTAIGIGPGIGREEQTEKMIFSLLNSEFGIRNSKFVFDADALNILSADKELLKKLPSKTILTPHPKEFDRLFGKTNNDFERLELQKKMSAMYDCVILLKGHHTIITTPAQEVYINSTGNAGMATGGSGDVLTGMITGLLAQGYNATDAAVIGMYLHGMAGDIAAKKVSQPALIASDIIDNIGASYLNFEF